MLRRRTTRREFFSVAGGIAATSWTGGKLFSVGASAEFSPNETINLGVIGCGARAKQLLPSFLNQQGVRLIAVCDVNRQRLDEFRQRFGGESLVAYHDFRKLLENKDIDVVIIATQAHWHVLCTIYACQAGKDVYLEKPLGNFVGEGRHAIEAARNYNRIVQFGTQQRSREHYRQAVEIIRSGKLGEISEVKVWDYENWYPGRGSPPDCDPPQELDWDFYVGPSPMMPYNPNCYYDYGYDWFKISGGGHQVAWGVHHFDIVHWALEVRWPRAVSAHGGKYAFPNDNRQWPDTFSAVVEYGPGPVAKHGFILQYSMRIGCRGQQRSHGKCFFGTQATLLIDRGRCIIRGEIPRNGKKAVPDEELLPADDESRHTAVFLENVRERKPPSADLEQGHYATNVGHLMNVAYEVGRRIRWDGDREQVIDDPQANGLINRQYRSPWKLELR